jgi:hypothetical protein
MKASKNYNNVVGEERLAHIRTIVVSLGDKLTYVFFYATTELHQWRYIVIFGAFILFCCWWPYFIVFGLCRIIRAYGCLLLLFMRLFWLFVLGVGHWSGYESTIAHGGNDLGTQVLYPLRACVKVADCCDPSFTGTLTCIKMIETCVENAFTTVFVRSTIAGGFLLFWWWRLGQVPLHQFT